MIMRIFFAVLLILTSAFSAVATPWQIGYEGDDFPENQGWTRMAGPQAAEPPGDYREIVDGQYLLLDSRREGFEGAYDHYILQSMQPFDPAPGEHLFAEWRTGSDATMFFPSLADTEISIRGAAGYGVGIALAADRVADSAPFLANGGQVYYISPGVMHEYRVTSYDMSTYALYVDGILAFEGPFTVQGGFPHSVDFGDASGNVSSVSYWDYVRFGVAPEPGTLVLLLMAWAGARPMCRRRGAC